MSLINCEVDLRLKWSKKCITVAGTGNNQNLSFQKTDTKLYFPVVPLSTQKNKKLIKQLEPGFKRKINWNKYLAKTTNQAWNRYLDYLIDPSFHGVKRPFVLSFKDDDGRESDKQYYLPAVEIKYYNVMIEGRNFFDQPIKSCYDNIRKIATVQGDDYATGYILDYLYFKKYYKLIAIDLSKQQLDPDLKAIQQINFTRNLDRTEGSTMFFFIEKAKEIVLDFSKRTMKVLWFYFVLIYY